jgi:pyruvate dehydrogenase E2 component (dihydrolipoamide acetyltransferase)
MEEGTIVNCPVKVGDEVRRGDCVFEIETDKTTLEMESPADGFVKYILVEVGQTLPVGEPLLVLGGKDEQVPQRFLDSLKAAAAAEVPPAVPATAAEPAGAAKTSDEERPPRAESRGATRDEKAEIKLGETIPLTKKQKLTAERMLKSKREIPCFYLTVKTDVTDLVDLRTRLNETAGLSAIAHLSGVALAKSEAKADTKISYNDFIIRAVAIGLQKFPIMTGQLAGNTIKLPCTINIGLAVSTPGGPVVPVVKDAHKKNVKQIAADAKALIEKAQNEKLLLTDLEGACITVSNLGVFGIDSFIPIVIPGQCSILGIGRITDTCVPDNGNVIIRKLMSMTLSVDHKITNGAYAAQFLDFTRKLLEDTSTFNLFV